MNHLAWGKSGRIFKTDTPNQFVYQSSIGQECTWDGSKWLPYLWKSQTNSLQYGHGPYDLEIATDKQILRRAGAIIYNSFKLFVQAYDGTGNWIDQPHGLPTKNIKHDYPNDGCCTAYLDFPDANYGLQLGMEVSHFPHVVIGIRLQSPKSAKVRFQLVLDGFKSDWKWIWARFDPRKGKQDRKIGIETGNFRWLWHYDEAPLRNVSSITNTDGTRKVTITLGPYDVTANQWLTIYPDTWGPGSISSGNDDCCWTSSATHLTGDDADGFSVVNDDDGPAMRWTNVLVANGATINDGTYIEGFTKYRNTGWPDSITWYGVDQDNVSDFNTAAPNTLPQTTASVNHTISTAPTDEAYMSTPELKTIVQEIVNRTGWSSGNALAILSPSTGTHAGWLTWNDYDRSSSYPAKLTIVYTSTGGLSIPVAMHHLKQQGIS